MVPGTLKALLNGLSILAWLLSRVSVRDRLVDSDRTRKPKKKANMLCPIPCLCQMGGRRPLALVFLLDSLIFIGSADFNSPDANTSQAFSFFLMIRR